ncbi:MAG: hypothetical protein O2782_04255, partial [bacterium]|nr:hypothetical protein [bacterium]
GATKCPGVACCLGVVAAHGISRRHPFDGRLWLAGVGALVTFVLLSPYVLLDFGNFSDGFLFQLAHAEAGRFGIDPGPLFHLGHGLRQGVGLLGWLVWLAASLWALRTRQATYLVVLAATLGGYVVISWGDLVFLRYVLPLLPLQAAVTGAGLCHALGRLSGVWSPSRQRWAIPVVVGLLLAQPLLGSLHLAEFSARRDTRTLAREWFQDHVPAGTSYCNFGGWSGDVQLRTYENQWWRFNGFLAYWPADAHAQLAAALVPLDGGIPFYAQAVHNINRQLEQGSIELIHQNQCAYIVTHQHGLSYSVIDSSFAQRLGAEGRRVARFDPGNDADAVFDGMDSYYVPVSGFDAERPGPLIEIWEVAAYRTPPRSTSQSSVLSRVLSLMAANAVSDGDGPAAADALQAAMALDSDNEHAWLVATNMYWDLGDTVMARQSLGQMLSRNLLASPAMEAMARLAMADHDTAAAIGWMEDVCRYRPRDAQALRRLAALRWQTGAHQRSLDLYRRIVELRPWLAQGHFDLGAGLLSLGAFEEALTHLQQAITMAPETAAYYPKAVAAHEALGQHEQAEDLRQRARRLGEPTP